MRRNVEIYRSIAPLRTLQYAEVYETEGFMASTQGSSSKVIPVGEAVRLLTENPAMYTIMKAESGSVVEYRVVDPGPVADHASRKNNVVFGAAADRADTLVGELVHQFGTIGVEATEEVFDWVLQLVRTESSSESFRQSVTKLPDTVTPATAAALQATENSIRAMEEEFGMLDSTELARLLGSKAAPRSFATELRNKGRVLGVRRLNAFVYPGFQFDQRHGAVKPVIAPLLSLAKKHGWEPVEVALWLCSPTTYLSDDGRPVDVLDDTNLVVKAAEGSWGVEW